jgi:hypothetical protein
MLRTARTLALLGITAAVLALGACQPNHPNTQASANIHGKS